MINITFSKSRSIAYPLRQRRGALFYLLSFSNAFCRTRSCCDAFPLQISSRVIITIGTWQVINLHNIRKKERTNKQQKNKHLNTHMVREGEGVRNTYTRFRNKLIEMGKTERRNKQKLNAHKTHVSAARATNYHPSKHSSMAMSRT